MALLAQTEGPSSSARENCSPVSLEVNKSAGCQETCQKTVGLLHKPLGQHTRCTEDVAREVCHFAPCECSAVGTVEMCSEVQKERRQMKAGEAKLIVSCEETAAEKD